MRACMPATVVGLLPNCGGNSEQRWGSWWTAMFDLVESSGAFRDLGRGEGKKA